MSIFPQRCQFCRRWPAFRNAAGVWVCYWCSLPPSSEDE